MQIPQETLEKLGLNVSFDDLDRLNGTIARTCLSSFNLLDDLVTFCHFAKNCVLHIQPRRGYRSDEELAAICVRSAICHRKKTGFIKLELCRDFIAKWFSPNRLTTTACSCWVSTLEHETLNNAVEDDSIVILLLHKTDQATSSPGCPTGIVIGVGVRIGPVNHCSYSVEVVVIAEFKPLEKTRLIHKKIAKKNRL